MTTRPGLLGDAFGALCLWATAVICATLVARPLHDPIRRLVRPRFAKMAADGVAAVKRAQRIRHPVLTWLVHICSATVGWGYYMTGLPVLLWIVDAHLGVQSIWLMFVATWMGNAMKDLLSCPRPLEMMTEAERLKMRSYVSAIDITHAQEYGAPSTHAMNSISMNAYLVLALEKRGILSEEDTPMYLAVACLWSTWLSFGRIYSALHTPGDLYLGYFLGFLLAVAWSQIDLHLYDLASTSALGWMYALILCSAAILLYPPPMTKPTPSWDQVVCFGGVAFGAVVGVGLSSADCLGQTSWPASGQDIRIEVAIVRFIIGGALLVCALKGSRPLLRLLLSQLIGRLIGRLSVSVRSLLAPLCGSSESKEQSQAEVLASGDTTDVEMLARFASYAMGGLQAVWLSHSLFCHIDKT